MQSLVFHIFLEDKLSCFSSFQHFCVYTLCVFLWTKDYQKPVTFCYLSSYVCLLEYNDVKDSVWRQFILFLLFFVLWTKLHFRQQSKICFSRICSITWCGSCSLSLSVLVLVFLFPFLNDVGCVQDLPSSVQICVSDHFLNCFSIHISQWLWIAMERPDSVHEQIYLIIHCAQFVVYFLPCFFLVCVFFSSRRLSVTVCPTTASSAFIIRMVQFSHKVQTIKRFSLKLNKYLCLKSREKRYWSLISLACSNTAVILFSSWFVFYVKL